ncbi:hypothetical protein A2767_07540 [Candidatus Roizmanbacteria bacterium RIFCSPHIGHO2_01_FULL_35_10]|uniref:Glycoside hydrolase family 5 domain-containing protein n=1 Tax=Candidatus Roizmanbacteria bacterium RIFCSPLOWO2_01_FULL_35_13 TaxID=1802055 RepID=A0A1F7ICQ4_9BACT|nr:MAG: hypothetical protein A2767_07540 [Candidatus Roizmanbacteria bacterium RIFCSPHIGHO2_01_FULL_35_10]OGK41122.1 MAG: hypothetical protein A3A74_02140 [Candidatus Roizmanbacteria bacterium RIFCSPLOWO2_01_FULL_35_13]
MNSLNRFRIKCGMTIFLYFIFHFLFLNPVQAYNPDLPNNKFGIHFALPNMDDLPKTKELINSNGGDWGYITLVMQENDRDKNKWQEVFDRMREFHLIPIIRLATIPQGAQWRRPMVDDADTWVDFLDSLHWVIKNRYVILFNEPNHGNEWGGSVDADDYAQVALEFSKKLKEKNPDFFIMLAGLDSSAPSSNPNYEDEEVFLRKILNSEFSILNFVDGLASHSYPNPGFSGSAYDTGRRSIRGYEWELNLLRQLGVKDLPVFITETGWQRGDENIIADNFKTAFSTVWLPDSRVVAVTPFVFDYQGEPFLNFSWKKYQSADFYPQYYSVQFLPKVRGIPEQIEKGEISFDFPGELVTQSSYRFNVKLKNLGQAVWDKDFGYQLSIVGEDTKYLEYFSSDLKRVIPFEEAEVDFYIKTSDLLGKGRVKIILSKYGGSVVDGGTWNFETFPLPNLNFNASLFPKFNSAGEDFELQIFNDREEIVLKKKGIKVTDGKGVITEVQNVALGRKYRIVLLKPYYLPRQVLLTFQKGTNELKFERMLPLDFNPDGKLDIQDIGRLFTQPERFTLLFP